MATKPCSFPSCDKPSIAKGCCPGHYQQFKKGQPLRPIRTIHTPITYNSAHQRVIYLWGNASQYRCVECGEQARDWAYDGTDPAPLIGSRTSASVFYSRYPEFYMPMCRPCHNRADRTVAVNELYEYRMWKMKTGLTIGDIPVDIAINVRAKKEAAEYYQLPD